MRSLHPFPAALALAVTLALAACGIAPAVQVNEDFHGYMKGEKLDQLLEVIVEEEKKKGTRPS